MLDIGWIYISTKWNKNWKKIWGNGGENPRSVRLGLGAIFLHRVARSLGNRARSSYSLWALPLTGGVLALIVGEK